MIRLILGFSISIDFNKKVLANNMSNLLHIVSLFTDKTGWSHEAVIHLCILRSVATLEDDLSSSVRKSVDQLKSLLEPDQEPSDSEVTGNEDVDLFKVPIILDANGISPFRQMNEANLKSLSDIMMLYIKF